MTNEEMHQAMEFIVSQQAQSSAKIGRATDERLSALINTVERQISEGRNGKP